MNGMYVMVRFYSINGLLWSRKITMIFKVCKLDVKPVVLCAVKVLERTECSLSWGIIYWWTEDILWWYHTFVLETIHLLKFLWVGEKSLCHSLPHGPADISPYSLLASQAKLDALLQTFKWKESAYPQKRTLRYCNASIFHSCSM